MRLKTVINDTMARASRSKRRAVAVREHGLAVWATGIDAVKNVAAVAIRHLKLAIDTQKRTISAVAIPVGERALHMRMHAEDAWQAGRSEVTTAISDGYHAVTDRLAHVTAVTHKEQALENSIDRKARKAKKRADAAAQPN